MFSADNSSGSFPILKISLVNRFSHVLKIIILKETPIIVFKVGEASLILPDGRLNHESIERVAMLLSNLRNSGKKMILVTAGSIAAGFEKLGMEQRPTDLPHKQAIAAIGQPELIKIYQSYFEGYDQVVSQVLFTRQIIHSHTRIKNARNTIDALLEMNIIPIINENDTVSSEDIEMEDNYPLSAVVATMSDAKLLVVKSDKDNNYLIIPRYTAFAHKVTTEDELIRKIEELQDHSETTINKAFPLLLDELEIIC